MRIGCCASPEQAHQLAAAGFDYLEANVTRDLKPRDAEAESAGAALAALPLPVEACNCFFPGDFRLLDDAADHDEVVAYAEVAARRARAAGVSVIVFGSGGARRLPDGYPLDLAHDRFVGLLRRIGDAVARHQITIAIEPLRQAETNFINTVTEGWSLVRRVAHPSIQLLADLYHVGQEGEDIGPLVAAGCRLAHVHIADVETRVAPIIGDPSYREFFAQIRAMGYDARVSIEGSWDDLPAQAPAIIAFLREAWAEAALTV